MKFNYEEFTSRNDGYVGPETQTKLKNLKVLIAGCGIGSQVAVSLARFGVQNFVLFDGDEVSLTNLNRQAFKFSQIDSNKANALKENILEINPEAKIISNPCNFQATKHAEQLDAVDFVFDTIDFLNMEDIVSLHEVCEMKKKPLLTGMSAGYGANVIFFPNQNNERHQFRKLFSINEGANLTEVSYVNNFIALFQKMAAVIDPNVVQVMSNVFKKLADNVPCPAPQVVGGAYCLSSVSILALKLYLNNEKMPLSPNLISVNMQQAVMSNQLSLL